MYSHVILCLFVVFFNNVADEGLWFKVKEEENDTSGTSDPLPSSSIECDDVGSTSHRKKSNSVDHHDHQDDAKVSISLF